MKDLSKKAFKEWKQKEIAKLELEKAEQIESNSQESTIDLHMNRVSDTEIEHLWNSKIKRVKKTKYKDWLDKRSNK